jgi:GT2 family glycosyltransferase
MNMNIFAGKKALCFIALPYHNRILLPIMEELQRRGMEVKFFTVQAEAGFEITLNDAHLPYTHALDYANEEVQTRITQAWRTMRPLWQEKLLTNTLIQGVPVVIQDKILRSALENMFCFRRMLEVEKPDVLFALHELNSWGKLLGYLSHEFRIPYITFQEGMCYARVPLYRFHTDYSTACVVWGEADRQVLLAAGCSSDKTVPLGNIDLWHAREKVTTPKAMAAARKALNIGPHKKVVLFLLSYALYNVFEPAEFLHWLNAHPDIVVVFKWHPIQTKDVIERALEKLGGCPSVRSVVDFNTYELLAISDACVLVGNSTTGIESLYFGKPLFEIDLPGHPYSYARQGVAEPCLGFEDVEKKLERLFTYGLPPERRQQVERFLNHYFAYRDGKTVDRIVAMTGEMLEARMTAPQPIVCQPRIEERPPCSFIVPVDDASFDSLLVSLKGLEAHVPAHLFEVLIVNTVAHAEPRALLASIGDGHIRVLAGEPGWSFAACCNFAAAAAHGDALVFLKPGVVLGQGWLEGMLETLTAHDNIGVLGGQVLNDQGLIWHIGVAFDINQSPFSLYRLLPMAFPGAQKQRDFHAVETPFLVNREEFCRMGGFSTDLVNRFEDIDFCLRMREAGRRVVYTPRSVSVRTAAAWQPSVEQDRSNCFRFYARWTGSLWQNDEHYLQEDGFDHDALSALYREFAQKLSASIASQEAEPPALG